MQMGREICVCLSRCNPLRDISRGVGNSSAQTVDDHVLVNGRGPASEALREGWSEAEVCAEELPLRGRPCMEDNTAASGKLAGWGAVAKSHREDAAGRGAVAELLVRAAGGNSWLGRPDRAATGRGAAAKSYREAVAGRGAAAKIHREESAMAKVPGSYVKFWKRVYICSIRLIRE